MADERSSSFAAGDTLGGRFHIGRLIGQGGMGEVYAATNKKTGREVALKIIRGADITPEQNRRFLREAKAATAIAHPNVIDVFDVFEDDSGAPVMVMELLEGETLASLIEREGKLSLAAVAALLAPVADALKTAHDKGIVHRDLKPDNVFLAKLGDTVSPKVLDFGIAKVVDPAAIIAETQGGATNTGSILGTPHYMSLEQAMSEKDIDKRADMWAFGVILFEALAGRRPLEFENLGQMYTLMLQGEVPSVTEHVADLPADLAGLVDHCLRKDRSERLDDLGPLIEVLHRHADDSAVATIGIGNRVAATYTTDPITRTRTKPSPQRGKWWLGAVAGVVALGAVGTVLAMRTDDQPAPATGAAGAPAVSESEPRGPVSSPAASDERPSPSPPATSSVEVERPPTAVVPHASPTVPRKLGTKSAAPKPPPSSPPPPPSSTGSQPRGLSTVIPY